jgi:hypothetical protein
MAIYKRFTHLEIYIYIYIYILHRVCVSDSSHVIRRGNTEPIFVTFDEVCCGNIFQHIPVFLNQIHNGRSAIPRVILA